MKRIFSLLLGVMMIEVLGSVSSSAAPPEWLTRLFPYTEAPDRLEHRIQRTDATELSINGRTAGVVTFTFRYPELDGHDATAQARIFLPPDLHDSPSHTVPLVHNAGYEIDENGAKGLLAKGYAVSTSHAHPLNPLGRGFNLDKAILHIIRRLPFINPRRVSIQGGSAGGWMTLMLTADAFPLVYAMPDVPPIHWGYNAAYIDDEQRRDTSKIPHPAFLQAVSAISQQSKEFYGVPFESPAYLAISPLAHLETVTVPTLVTFSTADILVPIDQVSAKLAQPFDATQFPPGYTSAMTDRFPGVGNKRTLLDALPRGSYEMFPTPLPSEMPRVKMGGTPPKDAKPIVLPFSKKRLWSIVVVDEGGKEPGNGHLKYFWGMDHEPFRAWAEAQGVLPEQLTPKKLERLMKRIQGEPWRPLRVRPNNKGSEIDGNVLDYPEAERADVLLGLSAFASDDACAIRLAHLYAKLPAKRRALGERLGDGTAVGVRNALASLIRP